MMVDYFNLESYSRPASKLSSSQQNNFKVYLSLSQSYDSTGYSSNHYLLPEVIEDNSNLQMYQNMGLKTPDMMKKKPVGKLAPLNPGSLSMQSPAGGFNASKGPSTTASIFDAYEQQMAYKNQRTRLNQL